MLQIIKSIIDGCWNIWNIDFTISGITFNLFDVAVVSVGIWIGSMVITAILED